MVSWKMALGTLGVLLPAVGLAGSAFSITYLGSVPERGIPSTDRVLGRSDDLVPQTETARDYATNIYWVFDAMKLTGVDALGVMENYWSESEVILESIEILTRRSEKGLVLMDLGPLSRLVCQQMATAKGFVFLVPAGMSGERLDHIRDQACDAANILTVASLNEGRTRLARSSNFGPSVDFAVPGHFGTLPNPRNVSYLVRKNACAFAALINFAEAQEFKTGSELAEAFEASLPKWNGLEREVKKGQALVTCADEDIH